MVADGEVPIVLDDGKLEAENHCVSRLSSTLLGGGPHEVLVVLQERLSVVLMGCLRQSLGQQVRSHPIAPLVVQPKCPACELFV